MPTPNLFHDSCMAMNTRLDVVCYGIDNTTFNNAFEGVKKELLRIENIISCYSKKSELFNLNITAYQNPKKVSDELFDILILCKELSIKTNGCFDITLKSVFDYWKKQTNKNDSSLNKILNNTGTDKIIFEQKNKTITYNNEYIKIDLGAIGKGYALEKINAILKKYNIKNIFISFGNSSILTKGKHPYGDHWPFGVCDIFKPEKVLHTFILNDHAVSTSATIQNTENPNNPSFHIINPKTGNLITEPKMISVKSSSPLIAEMLSTALLVADTETKKTITSNFKADEIIEIVYDDNVAKTKVL